MTLKVCKFGGSSLATAEKIKHVVDIVHSDPARRFVVVSAPGIAPGQPYKMTDILYNVYFETHPNVTSTVSYKKIDESPGTLIYMYYSIWRDITTGLGLGVGPAERMQEELVQLADNPDTTPDMMAKEGENNMGLTLVKYMGATFIDPKNHIYLTINSPDADNEYTMDNLSGFRTAEGIHILPGFFGTYLEDPHSTTGNPIRTFPRGGSDLTGALVAAGVGADLYENFTDQDGIFPVDPGLFSAEEQKQIIPIERASYMEIRELAYMGFKVLNDETIGPLIERKIPIVIKNTNNPDAPGTLVSEDYDHQHPVRGIAGTNGFVSLDVKKYRMNKEIGFGRDLLAILADEGISFDHIPSGIDSLSLVLRKDQLTPESEQRVLENIEERLQPDSAEFTDKHLAVISVVGEGMRHRIGMAAKATASLANHEVNIETMNQGASEISMTFGVRDSDYEKAIRGLYEDIIKPQGE